MPKKEEKKKQDEKKKSKYKEEELTESEDESDEEEEDDDSEEEEDESDDESEEEEDESDDEEEAKVPEKTKDKIKRMMATWMLLDDKIKEMDKKKKEYRDKKKEQEQIIIDVMSKYEFDECNVKDGNSKKNKITKTVSKSRGTLKPDILKAGLIEVFKDEKKADLLVAKILDKRPVTERVYLKRTKERVKK